MRVEILSFSFLLAFFWEEGLNRGWALINFFHFLGGRLFEVGANSRLGAKSNKYGIPNLTVGALVIRYYW